MACKMYFVVEYLDPYGLLWRLFFVLRLRILITTTITITTACTIAFVITAAIVIRMIMNID